MGPCVHPITAGRPPFRPVFFNVPQRGPRPGDAGKGVRPPCLPGGPGGGLPCGVPSGRHRRSHTHMPSEQRIHRTYWRGELLAWTTGWPLLCSLCLWRRKPTHPLRSYTTLTLTLIPNPNTNPNTSKFLSRRWLCNQRQQSSAVACTRRLPGGAVHGSQSPDSSALSREVRRRSTGTTQTDPRTR